MTSKKRKIEVSDGEIVAPQEPFTHVTTDEYAVPPMREPGDDTMTPCPTCGTKTESGGVCSVDGTQIP
jgi:hypothetical protein